MPLSKIKARSELLKKILSAIKGAEAEGLKDPLAALKKILDKRVQFKSKTPRKKKP